MGMYTGLRFSGIVKNEFRKEFKSIAMNGEWKLSNNDVFKEFGEKDVAFLIPIGPMCYMPDEWEDDSEGKFKRTYNCKTGKWKFQCSLRNYNETIEEFFKIVPYFMEKVDMCEVFYEEWVYSRRYEIVDGSMKMTDQKYSKVCEFNE